MAATPQLDLALRKNRGESIRRDWMARLKEACAYEILPEHFLALEPTETLKKEFFERVKGNNQVQRRQWPASSLEELANALMDLSIDLRSLPAVLFSSADKYLGAVQMPASVALSNFTAVWKVVEEDFCLVTLDLENGLCVEVNFYDERGNYTKDGIYKLSAWGVFASVVRL